MRTWPGFTLACMHGHLSVPHRSNLLRSGVLVRRIGNPGKLGPKFACRLKLQAKPSQPMVLSALVGSIHRSHLLQTGEGRSVSSEHVLLQLTRDTDHILTCGHAYCCTSAGF